MAWYLADALDDDRIERRARNGAKDRGDIGGVRCIAGRVVVEGARTFPRRLNLSGWVDEAETERATMMPRLVLSRKPRFGANMGGTYVTMTLMI